MTSTAASPRPAEPATLARRALGAIVARLNTPFTHPAALIGMGLLFALVAWLRLAPAARGAIWAEDGRDFLSEAAEYGPLRALFIPYAGYMHLIPRSIAGVVSLLPIDWWAQGMTAGACLVAGFGGVLVYLVTRRLPIAPWSRLLLAAITVLTPTLVAEVLGNAANMYTFALWCGLWLFLWRPQRWGTAIAGAVAALFICGTAIQIVALLPLLWFRRSRRLIPIVVAAAIGIALQAWGFTHSIRQSKPSWPQVGAINDGYLHQIAIGSWVESAHVGGVLIVRFGWIVAVLALLPYLAAAVLLWRSAGDRPLARLLALVLPIGSYVYWCAFFALNNLAIDYSNMSPVGLVTQSTLRYAVFPSMLLWALLVVTIGWRREPGDRPVFWRRVRAGVAAVLLVCSAVSFVGFGEMIRARGPEWSVELRHARTECAALPSTEMVQIPIAPVFAPWLLAVACSRVESAG